MNKRWTHSNKAVFNVGYHIIWCTKYRKPVLSSEVEERLKFLLLQKAKEIEEAEKMAKEAERKKIEEEVSKKKEIENQINQGYRPKDGKNPLVYSDYLSVSPNSFFSISLFESER